MEMTVYDYERPKINERGEQNSIVYLENIITNSQIFEAF
jgi:hypothetical protein